MTRNRARTAGMTALAVLPPLLAATGTTPAAADRAVTVSLLAGGAGDGGPAVAATLDHPSGVAVAPDGSAYIADTADNLIRRVDRFGVITTIAGTGGIAGFSGDGGPAVSATFNEPQGVGVGPDGEVYIADSGNVRVRRIDAHGVIQTVAGGGPECSAAEAVHSPFFISHPSVPVGVTPATDACLNQPRSLAVDPQGRVYIADSQSLWRLDQQGTISIIAGDGCICSPAGAVTAGSPADAAYGYEVQPTSVGVGASGEVYFTDQHAQTVGVVKPDGTVLSIAGSGCLSSGNTSSGDGGPAASACLGPRGVAADADAVYVADTRFYEVRRIDLHTQVITTVAGNGRVGPTADDVAAVTTSFNDPVALALQRDGGLLVADDGAIPSPPGAAPGGNDVARLDTRRRVVTLFAGTGACCFGGDAGPALRATLAGPAGIAVDGQGAEFISDDGNVRVRTIGRGGIISTAVGEEQSNGYNGLCAPPLDGSTATHVNLCMPQALAVDRSGDLFIADYEANRVRRMDVRTGVVTTIAGSGEGTVADSNWALAGVTGRGDGGPGTAASLPDPDGLAVDGAGNVYIGTLDAVRRVDAHTGVITAYVGGGCYGARYYSCAGLASADNGQPATSAHVDIVQGLAIAPDGDLYASDSGNNRVVRVDVGGVLHLVAGTTAGAGFSGDGGPATSAQLSRPDGLAFDAAGNLYIADTRNLRIRRIDTHGVITTVAGNGVAGTCGDGAAAAGPCLANPTAIVYSAGHLDVADGCVSAGLPCANRVLRLDLGLGAKALRAPRGAVQAGPLAGAGLRPSRSESAGVAPTERTVEAAARDAASGTGGVAMPAAVLPLLAAAIAAVRSVRGGTGRRRRRWRAAPAASMDGRR